MAVQTILVCDYCGQPAVETAGVRARGASWVIDLCADHLAEIMSHTRRAKPGRRPGSSKATTSAPKTRARRKRATKKTTTRRTRAKAASAAEAEPAS